MKSHLRFILKIIYTTSVNQLKSIPTSEQVVINLDIHGYTTRKTTYLDLLFQLTALGLVLLFHEIELLDLVDELEVLLVQVVPGLVELGAVVVAG